jgi:peroxiredoxin
MAGLQPGTRVPPLPVKTLGGGQSTLAFDGRRTILYYFSPTCGWCEKNWLNVKALAAATDGRVRFVGVSTNRNIEVYARERGLTFELFAEPNPEVAQAFQLRGTPQTIVISAQGVVEASWRGAYGPPQQKAIERMFGVLLPGLRTPDGN